MPWQIRYWILSCRWSGVPTWLRTTPHPAGAIADANLTGVTTADVAHLIPVVSESLGDGVLAAGGVPTAGFDDPGV
ncbi:hypothetical protein MAUB1S_02988 [Mycolicibacterium aubagnense]